MRFSNVVKLVEDEIRAQAPDEPGVYEVGYWVEPTFFVPRYIGRARGRLDGDPDKKGTTIRKRLLKHAAGKGNLNIKRALAGEYEEYWVEDPDDLSEQGKQKMKVDADLWCRWRITRSSDDAAQTATDWEGKVLQDYGYKPGKQYVWNQRL